MFEVCGSFPPCSLSKSSSSSITNTTQSGPSNEWTDNLIRKLPSYFNSSICGSCRIIVSDHSIECSKTILSAQSTVLEQHFSQSDGYSNTLILSDYYGYDDIVTDFFRAFYNGQFSLSSSTYKTSFKLCTQFSVPWMIELCRQFVSSVVTADNFIEEYIFVSVLGNSVLVSELEDIVKMFDYRAVTGHPKWCLLTKTQLLSLLPHLQAPTEVLVCRDIFNWMEYESQRKNSVYEIISHSRLGFCPINFLATTIESYLSTHYRETLPLLKMLSEAFRCVAMRSMGIPIVKSSRNPLKYYDKRLSYRDCTEMSVIIPSTCFNVQLETVMQKLNESVTIKVDQSSQTFRLTFIKMTDVIYCTCRKYLASMQFKELVVPVKELGDVYESEDIKYLPFEDADDEVLSFSYCVYNN